MECNLGWNHTRVFQIERARSPSSIRSEITSMISDQNCTTRGSITTLLHPFWNHPNAGLSQFKYFIDVVLSRAEIVETNRRREATMVVEKWSKPAQLVLRGKESYFGTTKLCICWKSFQHHEEFLYQPTRCSPRADCWSFSDALLQPEPEKQACRCLMRGRHQTQSYVNGFHTERV